MQSETRQNKGGRPRKEVLKNKRIVIACTAEEKLRIGQNATNANMRTSQYLCKVGCNPTLIIKSIPAEALHLTGELTRIGSNFNQIAIRLNNREATSAISKDLYENLRQTRELLEQIKQYLK